jgi:hypothetical protein
MSKTLICTNTLTLVNQVAYANHIQFYFRLGRNNLKDEFALFTPVRMTIDSCRNAAVKTALQHDFDYVMFIDDDVLVPFDAYNRLKAADKDVIAGWTVIRGYPFNNMFFKYDENKQLQHLNDVELNAKDLIQVDAIGCSCVLIKCELFKKIPPPYFVTGTGHTEDIYFCLKAKQHVPDVSIFVDPLVKTPHMLAHEAVTPENRLLRKQLAEDEDPSILQPINYGDRGQEYLDRIGGLG